MYLFSFFKRYIIKLKEQTNIYNKQIVKTIFLRNKIK